MKITRKEIFEAHEGGKLSIESKLRLNSAKALSIAYTPGVAEVSRAIAKDKKLAYDYTMKKNTVAIVTDGSRVLGLGDIGPEAALPVMEGKAILFKIFGGVDAFPICLATRDPNEIVEIVKKLAPAFGGINVEDIDAPNCFEVEERLSSELDIPVFHDDQHGTGIVVLAGLRNALKIVSKTLEDARIVIGGAGAGGFGITKTLLAAGARNIIVTDSRGIIYNGREEGMNIYKEEIAAATNGGKMRGTLKDAMRGADVFIGVTAVPNLVTREMVASMAGDAIVFALTNPDPEIMPKDAKAAGARIIATGRSDFTNQVNNALAFPGVYRGALDVRAKKINLEMRLAAAEAIAKLVKKPRDDYIIPAVNDKRVLPAVSKAVAAAATKTGVAQK